MLIWKRKYYISGTSDGSLFPEIVCFGSRGLYHGFSGPLGKPTHIEKVGTVLACGGGVGVAPLLPIVRAFKEAGNRVISVIAGRNKDLVILEDEIRASSDEVIIMTDDGSYGKKGLITEYGRGDQT